jgi:CIC family chloride channel protein
MIANMSAFALARHWRHTPVYEALLAQDGIRLPHGNKARDLPENARKLPADVKA